MKIPFKHRETTKVRFKMFLNLQLEEEEQLPRLVLQRTALIMTI